MDNKDFKNKRTIKELRERMERAKKRALRRAKRYNIGKNPTFMGGIIDGQSVSPYRTLALYTDNLLERFTMNDGDPDDQPFIGEEEECRKLGKDLYIYCTSAARIVTSLFKIRHEYEECGFRQQLKETQKEFY